MGIRLRLAFSIYVLYSICSFDCLAELDQLVPQHAAAENKATFAQQAWPTDVHAFVRARRHATLSLASLTEAANARMQAIDALSRPAEPQDGRIFLSGYEYDNKDDAPSGTEPDDHNKQHNTETPAATEPTESSGPEEAVSPLIVYLIIAGIVLMMIALLVISVAIIYIISTIPATDKDDEDARAASKGNARSRTPSDAFSRCPSLAQPADDERRRYSEQSVDLVCHKSRGSSLSRQSSCRICPRPTKSSRGRASCASTGTSSSGGGSDDVVGAAATATGKKDYFVTCVCDLPAEEEYSPSTSTTTTFGRC